MSRTKRNRGKLTWCDSEEEFNLRVERIKAEQIEPGKYRYMVKWYHRWNRYCETYVQYVAKMHAKWSGDHHQGRDTPPSAFVNTYGNRPLRNKHKQQIRYALETESWDGLLLEPYVKDAAWDWF